MPTDRATRSAAPRIFSKSTQRLPDLSRSAVHSNRPNKKVGSRPLIRSTTSERNQSIFPLHCKCKIRAIRVLWARHSPEWRFSSALRGRRRNPFRPGREPAIFPLCSGGGVPPPPPPPPPLFFFLALFSPPFSPFLPGLFPRGS